MIRNAGAMNAAWKRMSRNHRRMAVRSFATENNEGKNDGDKTGANRFLNLVEEQTAAHEADEESSASKDLEFHFEVNENGIVNDENTKNEIYLLHTSEPEKWTLETLSERFGFSPKKIQAVVMLKALEMEAFGTLDSENTEDIMLDDDSLAKISNDLLDGKKVNFGGIDASKDAAYDWETDINTMPLKLPAFEILDVDNDEPVVNSFVKFQHDKSKRSVKGSLSFPQNPQKHAPRILENEKKKAEASGDMNGKLNNHGIYELPNFSAWGGKTAKEHRTKIAIRDLSKSAHDFLMVRDADGSIRIATEEEASRRTWVRKPTGMELLKYKDGQIFEKKPKKISKRKKLEMEREAAEAEEDE